MFVRTIVLAALAVALGGCGGPALVKLQHDYERAWGANPPQSDQLLAVADQAESVADRANDARTAISALAMGGLAAVKAGPAGFEKAVKIGERGKRECHALPPDQFGTPRDCAVLAVVPDLAKWEQLAPRIEAVRKQEHPTTSDLPASANSEVLALNEDLASAWTGFNESTEKALATEGLDDTVKNYLSGERLTAYCNYDTFLQIASNLPSAGGQPATGFTATKESFCAIRAKAPPSLREGRCPNKARQFSDGKC